MLPQPLIERVGLAKDVALIGNLDSIEVWDREHWAKRQPELDARPEIASAGTARPRGAVAPRDTCS